MRKHYSAEEKIRIVLDGLRGESSIAELCRREGITEGLYYSWSKEFLEAGKRRMAGDTARAATSSEVTDLRREARALKDGPTARSARREADPRWASPPILSDLVLGRDTRRSIPPMSGTEADAVRASDGGGDSQWARRCRTDAR